MSKPMPRSARINFGHLKTLVARYFRQLLTVKSTLLPLILQIPAMLLIVFIIYDKDAFIDPVNAPWSANTTVFILIIISFMMGLLNSYREIIKEKPVLLRELSGGLDPGAYALSKLVVLAVVGIVQIGVFAGLSLTFIDFRFDSPALGIVLYLVGMLLINLAGTGAGLIISSLVKTGESAILPLLFVIISQVVFSGAMFDFTGFAAGLERCMPVYWCVALLGKAVGLEYKELYTYHAALAPVVLAGIVLLLHVVVVLLVRLKFGRTARQK